MIKTICERLSFPKEAIDVFETGYNKICTVDGSSQLALAKDLFFEGDTVQYRQILKKLSEDSGVHRYTVDMIFLLTCTDRAKQIFDQKGISEEIFRDTMLDLTEKLYECKKLHGVWGTFVVWWYPEFFRAERFTLGRLQFEKREFPFDDYKGIVKKGDTVYNFHVPSKGPLTYDAIIDAFKRAYAFYGVSGIMPIYFSSWLIYPPHAPLYAEGSNLKKFYELFDILGSKVSEGSREMWRVFFVLPTEDMDMSTLPEDTSLQRSFKRFLTDGNHMGSGQGIILFDGEKIIR
ncbi:MAG: hypothetical protein E7653_02435 [Ruminococcaceae bacterium]|nr:hypothetical protein [Oscillospiraceae bacterium]